MYPYFETIRIVDGMPKHLIWHQRRMERTYIEVYQRRCPFSLAQLLHNSEEMDRLKVGAENPSSGGELWKCRFSYNANDYTLALERYRPRLISTLKIVRVDALDYGHKYTDRSLLEKAFSQRGDADDILVSIKGRITDSFYANIVFYNGIEWVTPQTPLLRGTQRERLLKEGVIAESEIGEEDLPLYQKYRLINAMLEFSDQPDHAVNSIIR